MRSLLLLFFFSIGTSISSAQRTVHVMVPLCDHEAQGVVSNSDKFCDGQDPEKNLYWGARYGVYGYFSKNPDWNLVKSGISQEGKKLASALFHDPEKDILLLAEAFDGRRMKTCLKRFIGSAAGYHHAVSRKDGKRLEFGAESDLLAFCGHNGLMDVQDLDVSNALEKGEPHQDQDVAILACESKSYFEPYFEKIPQTPLIWTSGLMSPEAYTLDRIIEEWQEGSTPKNIRKAAAKTYDEYQDCGLEAAERLFLCSD